MGSLFSLKKGCVVAPLFCSLLFMAPLCTFAAEVVDQNAEVSRVLSAAYDDWTLKCVVEEKDGAKHRCEISQAVAVDDAGRRVDLLNLAISRARNPKGKAGFTLTALVPTDVHLPSDFGLSAGDVRLSLSRYRNCTSHGCFVIVPLSDQTIRRLKKAREGAAVFRDLAGRAIKVTFSLKGFTKAFDNLARDVVPAVEAGEKP